AEKAKIELSASSETEINQPYITQHEGQPLHLTLKLTRAKLEGLVGDLVQKTMKPVEAALKDAKVTAKDIDEVILVGGMTRMPKVQEVVKSFFGKDPHRGVNPDEVVAIGAAIQGGVLGGEVKDVLLLDVTPLTLSIETAGGIATSMIERNTTVPASKSQVFSTFSDNQTQVEINILQGERPLAHDNKSLGRFTLDGIPPAPRGVPQIEVAFDIDANGILSVKAKDKATSKEQSIKITGAVGLSDEEVKKAQEEAEIHAKEDQAKKEQIETRNQADALVFTAEKALKDTGDKAPKDAREKVEAEIKNVKEVLAKESASREEIEVASNKLSEVLQQVGQAMYQSGAGNTEQGTQSGPTSEDSQRGVNDEKSKAEEGEVVS
ncbi:MAG: Hsp70 family protein, partial [Candidatus Blackburnbacteria bacterium]|nr:Hsp70 family protein [Candidatus Blackburnbacteria bacterium]